MQQAGGEWDQQANEIHGKKPNGHIMDIYWLCEYQKIMKICLFLFQRVNCGPTRRGRRTTGLKVAMTFPAKKTGKRPASEPLPQNKVQDSEEEEEENFIVKRALNIKENKEMVLFPVSCCIIAVGAEPWQQTDSDIYLTLYVLACKAYGRAEQSPWTLPQTNGGVCIHHGTFDAKVQFVFCCTCAVDP